ncbi:MAG: ABC transporter permease subunit, partial [Acidobacteria bacterium]|nr:ABC transporter permease subunit [Acidobacteriota bacterium]
MTAYLSYTRKVAEATPAARNRIIDFWRAAAILVVVFGHWLAASIWLRADGEIALLNSLQWIPYSAWVTWIVQVMPIFFFVGGYANARALRRVEEGEQLRRAWITTRVRRLYTPVIPLLVVWLGFGMPAVIALVFLAVFVPIWLNTYIGVTSTDPHLLEVMRTFGASRLQVLRWVILPWALPSLIVGIRLAFSRGFVAVIVGEFIGSTAGLGYFISVAAGFYQT